MGLGFGAFRLIGFRVWSLGFRASGYPRGTQQGFLLSELVRVPVRISLTARRVLCRGGGGGGVLLMGELQGDASVFRASGSGRFWKEGLQ